MGEPRPDDLIAGASVCTGTLRPLVGEDWSAKAGNLDWTCREALEHVCALAYGPVLAARATEFRPLALTVAPDAPHRPTAVDHDGHDVDSRRSRPRCTAHCARLPLRWD